MNQPSMLPSGTPDLPDESIVTCKADGEPMMGLLVMVTLEMRKKNDYHVLFGPSDRQGRIQVRKSEILEKIREEQSLFPMDYEGEEFRGESLRVEPMGLRDLESALKAYEVYGPEAGYPERYREVLTGAWETLYRLRPRRLELDVSVPSNPSEAAMAWVHKSSIVAS